MGSIGQEMLPELKLLEEEKKSAAAAKRQRIEPTALELLDEQVRAPALGYEDCTDAGGGGADEPGYRGGWSRPAGRRGAGLAPS